jgi:hypothetical protein
MTTIQDRFSRVDSSAEQKVHVTFRREVLTDDEPDLSFLEQDYKDCSESERQKYRRQDRNRLAAFERGEWCMVGVRVVADVMVPIGQGSFRIFNIASPGVWGVESDSDESYLAEIEKDEKSSLIEQLAMMAETFATLKEQKA